MKRYTHNILPLASLLALFFAGCSGAGGGSFSSDRGWSLPQDSQAVQEGQTVVAKVTITVPQGYALRLVEDQTNPGHLGRFEVYLTSTDSVAAKYRPYVTDSNRTGIPITEYRAYGDQTYKKVADWQGLQPWQRPN